MTPRALVTAFYLFFYKFLWYFSKETSSVTVALLQIQAPHFRGLQGTAMQVSSQVLRAVQGSKARAPTSDIYKSGTRQTAGWKDKYVKKRSLVQKDAIKWKLQSTVKQRICYVPKKSIQNWTSEMQCTKNHPRKRRYNLKTGKAENAKNKLDDHMPGQ